MKAPFTVRTVGGVCEIIDADGLWIAAIAERSCADWLALALNIRYRHGTPTPSEACELATRQPPRLPAMSTMPTNVDGEPVIPDLAPLSPWFESARCDSCGRAGPAAGFRRITSGHRQGQCLCDHCARKHAPPCTAKPLVDLGQGDGRRVITEQQVLGKRLDVCG